MASTYNPYSDIQKVYNAKVAWNNATTDEERKRQNDIATAARKTLEAYGYSDVANQISANGADATAARKIMEKYAPTSTTSTTTKALTAPDSTSLSNTKLITTNDNETRNKINQLWDTQTNDRVTMEKKINQLWDTQTNDREIMANKYDKLEDTAYSNPFTTDEAKAILAKYDLSGLQARGNTVASSSASNGGNIDSYAAANALRQQTSLVNQGQMAVLDAHNNKINNVKGILSDLGVYQQNQDKGMQNTLDSLGVYQQNQDKGMQNTIGLQSNEGQRLFENEETAKNNEVARLSEQANVTGYTPSEWVIANDDVYKTYLNADGTFKKELENVDIQALINSAKASGDTETAKKLAVVRARKMLGNYGEFGKYANEGDISYMSPQITEARRESEQNDATVRETLKSESADTRYGIDAEKEINAGKNATDLTIAQVTNTKPTLTASQAATAIKNGEISQSVIDAYNYYYGTNYTVDNPPKVSDDMTIDLSGDNNANNTPKESKDIYSKWEDNGITFTTFAVKGPADETKLKSADVDEHGKKAIQSVYTAVANGELGVNGTVSNYDLAEYLINQSDNNDTNKNQLKKVFAYFGLDKNMLEQVEDSGFWFWQWGQGTNYKN